MISRFPMLPGVSLSDVVGLSDTREAINPPKVIEWGVHPLKIHEEFLHHK